MDFPRLANTDVRAVPSVPMIVEELNALQIRIYNFMVEDHYNYHGIIIIKHFHNTEWNFSIQY